MRAGRSWLALLVSAIFVLLAAVNLWTQVEFSLRGAAALGTVIDDHASKARSASVTAQVEVTRPGSASFRTEVEDAFGTQTWAEGGTVTLVCANIRADHQRCVIDSWPDRWLFPLLFLGIGAAMGLWQVRAASRSA